MSLKEFIVKELPELLDLEPHKLEESYKKGNLKFYQSRFITALQFRKAVGKIEAGRNPGNQGISQDKKDPDVKGSYKIPLPGGSGS